MWFEIYDMPIIPRPALLTRLFLYVNAAPHTTPAAAAGVQRFLPTGCCLGGETTLGTVRCFNLSCQTGCDMFPSRCD